jgi:DNA polymerase epsilon subunit 2
MDSVQRLKTSANPRNTVPTKSGASVADPVPSSSPAFGTPAHPIQPPRDVPLRQPSFAKGPSILPIVLPPAILRPLAFRTFTKKHNLTISTPALLSLATFIGKHCGSRWKDDGLAEAVLEEVAKMWKKQSSLPIVDGSSEILGSILKTIESSMSGGRIGAGKGLSRQASFSFSEHSQSQENRFARPSLPTSDSFGVSRLDIENDGEEEDLLKDPREWMKVINAFDQPRLVYNTSKKHFEKYISLFPRLCS